MSEASTQEQPEDVKEELPQKDLTRITAINWPSNPRAIIATQYVDVRDLELKSGQKGVFVTTPEGFVFERIDIVPLKPAEISLSISGDDSQLLGAFEVKGEAVKTVSIKGRKKVTAGEFYSRRQLVIENLGDELDNKSEGRLAITFIGYLIEPWR